MSLVQLPNLLASELSTLVVLINSPINSALFRQMYISASAVAYMEVVQTLR
jgi:hypothetical protein